MQTRLPVVCLVACTGRPDSDSYGCVDIGDGSSSSKEAYSEHETVQRALPPQTIVLPVFALDLAWQCLYLGHIPTDATCIYTMGCLCPHDVRWTRQWTRSWVRFLE